MGLKPRRPECRPDDILVGHSPKVVALANAARALLADMVVGVTERGYPGWRVIGIHRMGYLGYIEPREDHIRIGFEYGHALPDLFGVLEGAGSQVRYIAVRDREQLMSREVKATISMALFDDETHGFRSRAMS